MIYDVCWYQYGMPSSSSTEMSQLIIFGGLTLSGVCSILGIISSFIGLKSSSNKIAIIGIIIGVIVLVLVLLLLVLLGFAFILLALPRL